jgi:hypothetical protein
VAKKSANSYALTPSTPTSTVELNLSTDESANDNNEGSGSWAVYINGYTIAYWPDNTFNGGFYTDACETTTGCTLGGNGLPAGLFITAGAPMQSQAAFFQVGGEVAASPGASAFNTNFGSSNAVKMGNGVGGIVGKGTAYFRNVSVDYGPYINGVLRSSEGAPFSQPIFATDLNCYNYGYGVNGVPQTVSLSGLGYTVLQYPGEMPTSVMSPGPGGSSWGTYLFYGGLGWSQGFNGLDPKGGTNDFCCSTLAQNGVGEDTQCEQSSSD